VHGHTADPLAVVARTVGAASGVLTVNTTLYVGPLAEIAGGVDLSTIGSAALAGLLYAASLRFIKA
jgi:purine-cytosine permease-like protein